MEQEEGELFLASPSVKNYHIIWNLFLLGSQIPLEKVGGRREMRLLVVPRELRKEVLCLCHDVPA